MLHAVKVLARQHETTLFMVGLAAFATVLWRWSGQRDLVIGSDVAGRNHPETEPMLGFFVNQLALRLRIDPSGDVGDLLGQTRRVCLEAYQNQDLPFNAVIERLALERDTSRTPVFQVKFTLENTPTGGGTTAGIPPLRPIRRDEDTSQFELLLALKEMPEGAVGSLRWRTDLFDRATAERLLDHYRATLAWFVESRSSLAHFAYLGAGERTLLDRDNGTAAAVDLPALPLAFASLSRDHADRTALQFGDASLTYSQLRERVAALTARLQREGIGPEQPIGVCLARGPELVIALLAVLSCGACYVPLDPDYGDERIRHVLEHAGATVLIAEGDQARHATPSMQVIAPHADGEPTADWAPVYVHPTQLAYVIYTSGSTGRPKGVAISHGALANFLAAMRPLVGLTSADTLLAVTTVSFDIAALELFLPLLDGACVYIARREQAQDPRELLSLIRTRPITAMQATPASWRALSLIQPDRLELTALCGGEALPDDLARDLLHRGAVLTNVYGPTETTIWSSYAPVDTDTLQGLAVVPLGRPLRNTTFHVLGDSGQPQPVGVVGELHIGGEGVARGYFRQPALTAAAFVPDPFSSVTGARLFRTGDLVRRLADGRLVFLGRSDHQIKIRGHRIELGEIEAVLAECPGVAQVVVVTPRDASGALALHAWLRTQPDAMVDADTVRTWAARRLPAYMIPARLSFLAEFPLSAAGKTDRRALLALTAPMSGDDTASTETRPLNEHEQHIAEIWKQVLGVATVSLRQNFFDAGGHSLLAVALLDRVERDTGRSIGLQQFFADPTVAGIVHQLHACSDATAYPRAQPRPDAADQPFPLTSIQQAYWLGRGADLELGGIATQNYLEIGMRDLDPVRFTAAWNRLVRRHGMLRAVFLPDGRQRCLAQVQEFVPAVHDLSAHTPEAREAFLSTLRERMRSTVLPADTGPLFDLIVCRLDAVRWQVHFCIDMLISDVVSNQILFDELGRLYADPDGVLSPLQISFRDYVLVEQDLLRSERFQQSQAYWRARAPEFPGPPELPLAVSPAQLQLRRFVRRRFHLPQDAWTSMKEHARQHRVSPTVLVLSVFAEILGAWSKSSRFALNLTLFNRLPLHADVDRLVGDFTSSLLLEITYRRQQSFADRLGEVQQQLWRDLDHRLFGGVEMIRELGRLRGGAQAAAMPVVFTSMLGVTANAADNPLEENAAPGGAEEIYSASQTSQVWIDHQVAEEGGGLSLVWDVLESLFPAGLLDDMFAAYTARLQQLAHDRNAWLQPTPDLLPAPQRDRRLASNATQAHFPDECLHSAFARQVRLRPQAPAVQSRARQLSYAELDALSDDYAAQLQTFGVSPGTLVAVLMDKGWEQVVAVLAVLKSGAAYIPIDADLPAARRAQIIEESGALIALTQTGIHLEPGSGIATCLKIEPLTDGQAARRPQPPATGPADIAYVIFTSGSTGKPKGVVIDHRGAVNTVADINQRLHIGPHDAVLALSSLSFDLSVYDIFGVLGAGGRVVIPTKDELSQAPAWLDYLSDFGVTVWNTVPALMQLAVDCAEAAGQPTLHALRLVMMSGDWIPVTLPDRIRAVNPAIEVISLGGATEASIWSIFHTVDHPTTGLRSVPYGKPLANQTFHVLDDAYGERPDWVPGPLYIGGIGLALGYWRDAERTAASFITTPDGRRLYRTGDNGRYLPDGSIEFLGREDTQVKVQGYRIELGDIESALQSHPAVNACAVAAIDAGPHGKTLVAYVVPAAVAVPAEDDVAIRDSHARALFKLEQRGHRRMPTATARRPRQQTPIAQLLQGLQATVVGGQALPKYRYPSASSLYPVQLYVHDDGGFHYYSPIEDALVRVADTNPLETPVTSEIRLYWIADLEAIRPLYAASETMAFCELETGYMQAVIEADAQRAGQQLNLVVVEPARLVSVPALPAEALWLASATVSASTPVQAPPPFDEKAAASTLALPAATRHGGDPYTVYQRQSFRRYATRQFTVQQLGDLLVTLDSSLDAWIYVKPGQCTEATVEGLFRYCPNAHTLTALPACGDLEQAYNADNRRIYRQAAFVLFLRAPEATGQARQRAGALGQKLMGHCWRSGLGLCPIGHVDAALLPVPADEAEAIVVHSFLGGCIDPAQLQALEPEHASGTDDGTRQLIEHLAQRLPTYMLPRQFIVLESLPLTSNGKVDRKALPVPESAGAVLGPRRSPQSQAEKWLAAVWRDVLGIEDVGIDDSFFSLGGNSLLAIRIASRLRQERGISLSLRQLFEYQTIADLAPLCETARQPVDEHEEIDIYTLRRAWQEEQQQHIRQWLAQIPASARDALAAAVMD